jgi:hypothetical protein
VGWISRQKIFSPPVEAELFFLTSLFIELIDLVVSVANGLPVINSGIFPFGTLRALSPAGLKFTICRAAGKVLYLLVPLPASVPGNGESSMKNLAMLLCLATVTLAADQITFRGAYIGQPLSDYIDCSTGKAKPIKESYKPHGKLCEGKPGTVSRIKYHARILSGNGGADEGEMFLFEDRKIARIKIFVPDESEWEKVKYDLTQKLGSPSSDVPQIFQNGFGARWEYDQGFWVNGNTVAYAGIKVSTFGHRLFSNAPMTEGIEVNITDAQHAKLPSTTPSTLDLLAPASAPEPAPDPAVERPADKSEHAQQYADCLTLAVDNPSMVCKQEASGASMTEPKAAPPSTSQPSANGTIGASADGNPRVRHDGVTVSQVVAGGPADQIGIKVGDVILAIDDHYLFTIEELNNAIDSCKPGYTIKIRYRRYSMTYETSLIVGNREAAKTEH